MRHVAPFLLGALPVAVLLHATCQGPAASAERSAVSEVAPQATPAPSPPERLVPALVADDAVVEGFNDCGLTMEPGPHARPLCYFGGPDGLAVIKGLHRPDEVHSPADALLRDAKSQWRWLAPGEPFPKIAVAEEGAIATYALRYRSAGKEYVFSYAYRAVPGLTGIVAVTGFDSATAPIGDERAQQAQEIVRRVAASVRVEPRPDHSVPTD